MKNNGTYRGQIAMGGWDNRQTTQRMRRAERQSERARFNNRPAPEGTLPAPPPVQAVIVSEPQPAPGP